MTTRMTSQFQKGQTAWNKGKGISGNCLVCAKEIWIKNHQIGRKKFCSRDCLFKSGVQTNTFKKGHAPAGGGHTGHSHSEEARKKISDAQRIKNKDRVPNILKVQERGYKKRIRQSFQWKEWRSAVFTRDLFTCKECGATKVYLEPHHIVPIRSDLDKLFEVTNGITLCRPCHRKTIWKEEEFMDKYTSMIQKQMSAYC